MNKNENLMPRHLRSVKKEEIIRNEKKNREKKGKEKKRARK